MPSFSLSVVKWLFMKRRSPFWLLIVGVGSLALSGCASLMESGASLLGREPVPARVAGLPLGDLATLGIDDGVCAELAEARRQDRRVSGRWLREDALPACARRIEAAREARRYDQALDRLVEQAWRAEQAAERERARQRAEQRRVRERGERCLICTICIICWVGADVRPAGRTKSFS